MAYPTLTDNPGAIELAEAMRRGEMSPLDAVEAAPAAQNRAASRTTHDATCAASVTRAGVPPL